MSRPSPVQSPLTAIPSGRGAGKPGCCKQAALWNLVLLSVAEAVVHESSNTHGGVQVTTRHTIGPTQAIS